MERRRRALGIRKPSSSTEERTITNCTPVKKNKYKIAAEEVNVKEGKESKNNQTGSVTPKHITPKHQNVTCLKTESPGSPLVSPGFQGSLFPRTLGSPEIEVSWDWGCSQVPKEMVPPRRVKRVNQSQPPPVVVPEVPSCPRLIPSQQVSEEENQERLAFYKNVLSKSVKRLPEEVDENSEKDVEEEAMHLMSPLSITPKGLSRSRLSSGKKEAQVVSFLDDSANDFMLECSQAIENQLKNGEINIGPTINIQITNRKHCHSPLEELENVNKKVCHGRTKLNLFPEAPNNVESSNINLSSEKQTTKSLQNKQLKSTKVVPTTLKSAGKTVDFEEDDDIFMKPTQINQSLVLNKVPLSSKICVDNKVNGQRKSKHDYATNSSKQLQINIDESTVPNKPKCAVANSTRLQEKHKISVNNNNNLINGKDLNIHNNQAGKEQQNGYLSTRYDGVDKFRRAKNNPMYNNNQHLAELKKGCDKNINNTTSKLSSRQTTAIHQKNSKSEEKILTNNLQDSKPRGSDFQSLLDDGFDKELSTLDFDSLCCSSQTEEMPVQTVLKPAPKLCSQQEIEAKRKAALNRLMLKKKR